MTKKRLVELVGAFGQAKIGVIGDLILDGYLWSLVERISPEAPVPIAKVEKEEFVLGGAGNVANNLRSLGVLTCLFGVIGEDEAGEKFKALAAKVGCGDEFIISERARPTSLKTRILSGGQQLLRLDREQTLPISSTIVQELTRLVSRRLSDLDLIVFSDYAKGTLTKSLVRSIIAKAKKIACPVLVDPKPATVSFYRGADLIKPNRREVELMAGRRLADDLSNLESIGRRLETRLKSRLLVTLGREGMALFTPRQTILVPTVAQEVFDVSGAGDTTLAAIAATLAVGGSLEEAAIIGNLAAGVVVSKIGTATVSPSELIAHLPHFRPRSVKRCARRIEGRA